MHDSVDDRFNLMYKAKVIKFRDQSQVDCFCTCRSDDVESILMIYRLGWLVTDVRILAYVNYKKPEMGFLFLPVEMLPQRHESAEVLFID